MTNGQTLRKTELEPGVTNYIRPFVETVEGGKVYGGNISVNTKSISLSTLEPTSISNRSATLNGTIDCDNYSSAEFGMQWQEKTGWTTDPRFTKGRKGDDGNIALTLVNGMLKPDTEYKYRTAVRYQGQIYYASEWKDLRTELEFIVYPATAYTLYRTDSENNCIVLCGYYVAGSEDVLSQGYEYWRNTSSSRSMNRAAQKQVLTTDSTMNYRLSLSALEDGIYTVQAFVKTATTTYYGQQLTFSVGDVTAISDVNSSEPWCTTSRGLITLNNVANHRVSVYNAKGVSLYSEKCESDIEYVRVPSGVYIIRFENGKTQKVAVK